MNNHSIDKPFKINGTLSRKHPQITFSDLRLIESLKKSGKFDDWDTLFEKFLTISED